MIRVGRYGPYLDRDGPRVNVPEDLAPDELTAEKAEELFSRPTGDRELGKDPETGHGSWPRTAGSARTSRRSCPEEAPPAEGKKRTKKADAAKPRTGSLLKTMSLDTITLEDALQAALAAPGRSGRSTASR